MDYEGKGKIVKEVKNRDDVRKRRKFLFFSYEGCIFNDICVHILTQRGGKIFG